MANAWLAVFAFGVGNLDFLLDIKRTISSDNQRKGVVGTWGLRISWNKLQQDEPECGSSAHLARREVVPVVSKDQRRKEKKSRQVVFPQRTSFTSVSEDPSWDSVSSCESASSVRSLSHPAIS